MKFHVKELHHSETLNDGEYLFLAELEKAMKEDAEQVLDRKIEKVDRWTRRYNGGTIIYIVPTWVIEPTLEYEVEHHLHKVSKRTTNSDKIIRSK